MVLLRSWPPYWFLHLYSTNTVHGTVAELYSKLHGTGTFAELATLLVPPSVQYTTCYGTLAELPPYWLPMPKGVLGSETLLLPLFSFPFLFMRTICVCVAGGGRQ